MQKVEINPPVVQMPDTFMKFLGIDKVQDNEEIATVLVSLLGSHTQH